MSKNTNIKIKVKNENKQKLAGRLFGTDHLVRDAIIIVVVALGCWAVIFFATNTNIYAVPDKKIEIDMAAVEEHEEKEQIENINEIEDALASVDVASWKKYTNTWYGFEISYPDSWPYPTSRAATASDQWEYRFLFRAPQAGSSQPFAGFDVVVYNFNKTKDVFATDEFPTLKDPKIDDVDCTNIKWNYIEPGNYPAEEVHIEEDDLCHEPGLFFSLTRDQYIYNFVLAGEQPDQLPADPFDLVRSDFPQYFAAASTLDLVDINRPKPKPRITAPKPVSFKIDEFGRMVCGKKNDKPSMSKKTKEKHLDMECCLDPDEYPNPWCWYDPNKYGKYL